MMRLLKTSVYASKKPLFCHTTYGFPRLLTHIALLHTVIYIVGVICMMFFAYKTDLEEGGPYAPFSAVHIAAMLLALLLVAVLIRRLHRAQPRTRHTALIAAAASLFLLNITRLTWELIVGGFDIAASLPLQLCGLQMFSLPLAIFFRGTFGRAMRAFVFTYGTAGAVLALLLPLTTLYDYPMLHFRTIHTFLYHTVLLFGSALLIQCDNAPTIADMNKAYAVLGVCVIVAATASALTGGNYLYTARLPLPTEVLAWPWHLPPLLAFALVAGRIPFWVHHLIQRRMHTQKLKQA